MRNKDIFLGNKMMASTKEINVIKMLLEFEEKLRK